MTEHFDIDRIARPEVVTHRGVDRSVSHSHHAGKARQVIPTGEFRKKAFYTALDCVVHRMAICVSASVTLVIRSPWLIVAPGRSPGRAATIALWLPW